MLNFENASLSKIFVHQVGNKGNGELLHLSKQELQIKDGLLGSFLQKYFLSSFKSEEFYNLHHESDILLNEVYVFTSEIFDAPNDFFRQSVSLARHLFEKSTHPKIKAGEFYVVYFQGCILDGESLDAVGFFKSENKDVFLKVLKANDNFEINYDDGININKLDKGCLIFNTEREKGYLVAIVDNVSKGYEAQYWKDEFLYLRPRNDNYHCTQNVLNMCKNFVVEKLPEEFEVSRTDQADLLNKSVKFFKENERFNINDFAEEVMGKPEVIESFNNYRKKFTEEFDVDISDEFGISSQAVKKQQRVFKSVIKLDKNFHIYVHGNNNLIERGFDEATGMYFYKVYFKEEL